MSAALYDSVARIARHEARARAGAGIGKVVDLFPADGGQKDHACSVEMVSSGLVLPRVPIAVGAMGFAAIPAIDDLVLVIFVDGDHNAPVVAGRLYHPDQDPPKHGRDELVLALPSGEDDPALQFSVLGKKPSITLKLKDDVSLTLEGSKVVVAAGEITLTLETAGGGRAEIAAGGSKLTVKKDGDVTLEAAGKLKLKGTEIEISGDAKVKVSGGQVEIN